MLQTISVTVIAASFVVLVIILIPVALQIRRTAREAEKLLKTIRLEITPLSQDLAAISKEIRGILESIHRDADGIEEGITAIRDAAERLGSFAESALTLVDGPLIRFAGVAIAASRGFGAFLRFFRGTREG